jgi:hypothetical protein
MMHVSIDKHYFFFIFIICLGLMAFLIFPPYGMDDCYITYRYAYNLFHHHQFVFNLGERILGTTSPLYTIVLTIAQIFSDNIPLMSNLISCTCSALAGFLLFLVLKKDNLPLGVFCALSFPFMLRDIGLETNFLMFLFTAALYLFARENYLICGAVLGLCFLTRQDSAVFIATLILMFWLKKKRLPWSACGVFGCIAAPWFIFSYFYFDALFPTSLQEKKGYADFIPYFIDAFGYLAGYCDRYSFNLFSFLGRTIAPLLPPIPCVAQNSTAAGLALTYLLFTLLALTSYLRHVAHHQYAGAVFYLYPLLMITALSVIGPPPEHRWHLTGAVNFALIGQLHLCTAPLITRIKKRRPPSALNRRCAFLMALLGGYLLCCAALNLKDFYTVSTYADRLPWFGARYNNYKTIGCFLRETVSDEETVFVLEVGTIGYYSMKRMIDGAGIIAPGYGEYHREGCWLRGLERAFPDYIVTGDFEVPFYKPIFHFQNNFTKTVVYRKLQNLPEQDYPFSQLCRNWKSWKGRKEG